MSRHERVKDQNVNESESLLSNAFEQSEKKDTIDEQQAEVSQNAQSEEQLNDGHGYVMVLSADLHRFQEPVK